MIRLHDMTQPFAIYFVCQRLPVKTLQLEQMAVAGRAEEPSVVASRMRLVFSTLEVSKVLLHFSINERISVINACN